MDLQRPKQTRCLSSEESANRDPIKKTFEPSDKVKGMYTHTHIQNLSLETKHLFIEKRIRALHHNNGCIVTKNRYYIQCQFWDGYKLSPVRDCGFRRTDYMVLALQLQYNKKRKDTESYYYDSALLLSGFHSSPITSSNDSNLSCCRVTTWFISKWQTDVCVCVWGEIGCCQRDTKLRERISVPHNIHKIQILPISVQFQLGLKHIFRKASEADVNSLHHMPQLICFTMTM